MANLYEQVNTHYSSIAREDEASNAEHMKKVALSFGYNVEDLACIPDGSNLGVSCGNPLTIAGLKEGETVVDLGCGGGFDVFQAARKVGVKGLVIGVDLSDDMLARARANAEKSSTTNVKFVKTPITEIELPSDSTDCIISNCVINLVPHDDKHLVFKEIYRLLKAGGRVSVSDLLAKKQITPELQSHLGLYVGCISGASLVGEYENWLKEAGFQELILLLRHQDPCLRDEQCSCEHRLQ
ncbi:hypothetical protein CNBJ2790 [Cryptococcus deneoformans B-3501A]|uniref:hypothetical protein n=1 Tax=Cryptococcus deneoformans (strain B-3501A) TaxID=283643 RepID=UPI000042CC37|nr:hypothetical protein CNBJ2790 [Cryptococcus neoformans var. neoformans B-3501A]EAL18356.1 hypothetical protein CNBJ2790 [Cryptococcus neoformans var. neoformans B-3501A]